LSFIAIPALDYLKFELVFASLNWAACLTLLLIENRMLAFELSPLLTYQLLAYKIFIELFLSLPQEIECFWRCKILILPKFYQYLTEFLVNLP